MAADALKYIRTMTADPAKAVTMMGRHEQQGGDGGRRCQSQYGIVRWMRGHVRGLNWRWVRGQSSFSARSGR